MRNNAEQSGGPTGSPEVPDRKTPTSPPSGAAFRLCSERVERWKSRAIQMQREGKLARAEGFYLRILEAEPGNVTANYLLAVLRIQQHRPLEAFAFVATAFAVHPQSAEALLQYGNLLCNLGNLKEALSSYNTALTKDPSLPQALIARANILTQLREYEFAVADYDAALALCPGEPAILNNRGNALAEMREFQTALISYDRAVEADPSLIEPRYNRANMLANLGRHEDAISAYDMVLAIEPNHPGALNNRGNIQRRFGRLDAARESYEKLLSSHPEHRYALSGLATILLNQCDWQSVKDIGRQLRHALDSRRYIIAPFTMLGYTDDPSIQKKAAQLYASTLDRLPPLATAARARPSDKIKIAYLSADFHDHATTRLITQLIKCHDRSRFEVCALSFGPDDASDERKAVIGAFDEFWDMQKASDRQIAQRIAESRVDIAIDLKGYTHDARPCVFLARPAPIQVSYLGYPSTMGTESIDYIIGDRTILPPGSEQYFCEKIVRLPDCYQANSWAEKRLVPESTRDGEGLPPSGYVFCCFNNSWKITEQVFAIWMRLLNAVEGSVLWLICDNESAKANLQGAATDHGVAPQRLVFAPRVDRAKHLGRHRCADLFLDTLPVNAHTTAADALMMGVPLVTCLGHCFAGRVAASLLSAVGMPELVTQTHQQYEALALHIARDEQFHDELRNKLLRNCETHPLFDTERLCRHIEIAYTQMWDIWRCGGPPQGFQVQPLNA